MIGYQLVRKNNENKLLKGIIVETEAYSQEEEACHGFNNKTNSNKTLFGEPGIFYVYRSYGIHYCLNVVTDKKDFASGVLIRSILIPGETERIASGPGLVTRRFGIDLNFNSANIITNKSLTILKGTLSIKTNDLIQTKRIGISKANNLPWRWYLKNCRSISKRAKGDKNPDLSAQSKQFLIDNL